MPDIALLGDKNFLFEKLFQSAGVECQFLKPELLGSPFLPRFRLFIIPTGFANSQYSKALPALRRCREGIASFLREGGVLVVFGPLVLEHDYDWLPLPLKYVGEYHETQTLSSSGHECSCLSSGSGDCDGYLIPSEEFHTVLADTMGRPVLVLGQFGDGLIVATSVHEFPTEKFIRWAAERGKPGKI